MVTNVNKVNINIQVVLFHLSLVLLAFDSPPMVVFFQKESHVDHKILDTFLSFDVFGLGVSKIAASELTELEFKISRYLRTENYFLILLHF